MRQRYFISIFRIFGLFLFLFLISTPFAYSDITAVWANNGQDKVARDELRATNNPAAVHNSVWDGSRIALFGAKNEVVAFNLIIEADQSGAENVSVSFHQLNGPEGHTISSPPDLDSSRIFNWINRNIELFYVRYLQIRGLSIMHYADYDERHVPERFRRPFDENFMGQGVWEDRPDYDRFYPDIAVPLELHPVFTIPGGAPNDRNAHNNQSIWADIYIPKNVTAGRYTGTITVSLNNTPAFQIPVELTVRNFTLPDVPSGKTMLFFGEEDVRDRYFGDPWMANTPEVVEVYNKHMLMAHRHRISLINTDYSSADSPSDYWIPWLNGQLFTPEHQYDGPGVGMGNNIYVIGTYGSWPWREGCTEEIMRTHSDAWVNWFEAHFPETEYFIYLIDESSNYAEIEMWAGWVRNNPGPGQRLQTMATIPWIDAMNSTPSLSIPAMWMQVGDTATYDNVYQTLRNNGKRLYLYNSFRPANGTFATEDDGVALRSLAWGQYKRGIDRWYKWESTYYDNYHGGTGKTNVFTTAQTFGSNSGKDLVRGETGWNYSNGDGLLFYPGTDRIYPGESYNIDGPIASLRLKLWRRGLQDIDYLTLAAGNDPGQVQQIVDQIIPKIFWEYGVPDMNDPSYVITDISWSADPDVWENARKELADIIEQIPPQPKPSVQITQHPDQAIPSGTNAIQVEVDFQNPGNEIYRLIAQLIDVPDNKVVGEAIVTDVQQSGIKVIDIPVNPGTPSLEYYRIEVKCYNAGNDLVAHSQVTVDVTNHPPVIVEGPTATPSLIKDNETSVISVSAYDPDAGDVSNYQWSSDMGAVEGSGAEVTFVPPTVQTETVITITVVISDNHGGVVDGSVSVTVQSSGLPPGEGQTPWLSNEHLYPDYQTGIEYCWANTGYEFTPEVSGHISKVGGSFYGSAQITLWKNVQIVNGVRTGEAISTITLDASDNSSYEWRFINLPEPVAVEAGKRYAITMHAALGVLLSMRSSVPHEVQFGDIVIHYPLIGDVDKTPADYPEWNAPYMSGQLDIFFVPNN